MNTRSPHDLWPIEDTEAGPQHTFRELAPLRDQEGRLYLPGDELGYKARPGEGPPAYVASSASKEWYTPKWLLEEVYNVLGSVDLDPAAPPAPHTQWVRARQHITEQEDGLKPIWYGSVFLNPPYGRKIGVWVAKLAELHALRYVSEAILLVPARTDARWFEDVWSADCLCFITGRLQFEGPNKGKNTATFPSVVAYYGPRNARFANHFEKYGKIILPKIVS